MNREPEFERTFFGLIARDAVGGDDPGAAFRFRAAAVAEPRADGIDRITLDVGDRVDPRLGAAESLDQLAVLDARNLFTPGVDLRDGLAAGNHRVGLRLQVGKRRSLGQRLRQRRGAAGDEQQQARLFAQSADALEQPRAGAQRVLVRNRVPGLDDLDARLLFELGLGVAVLGDDQGCGSGITVERAEAHAGGGLADGNDQVRRKRVVGVERALHRGTPADRAHGGLPDFGQRALPCLAAARHQV